jgi:hypothetical protein
LFPRAGEFEQHQRPEYPHDLQRKNLPCCSLVIRGERRSEVEEAVDIFPEFTAEPLEGGFPARRSQLSD